MRRRGLALASLLRSRWRAAAMRRRPRRPPAPEFKAAAVEVREVDLDLLVRGRDRGGTPVHRVGADLRPHRRAALRRRRRREEGRGHRAHRRARREPGGRGERGAGARGRRRGAQRARATTSARASCSRRNSSARPRSTRPRPTSKQAQARLVGDARGRRPGRHRAQLRHHRRALQRRGLGAPRRAGRDGGARQAADDRLRSLDAARGGQRAAGAGRGDPGLRQGAHRGALARALDRRAPGHRRARPPTRARTPRACAWSCPSDARGVYPGVFARAHFAVGRAPRLLAPRAAVFQRSELTGVYVIDDQGLPRLRQIRLGTAGDERCGRSARGPEARRARRARAGQGRHAAAPCAPDAQAAERWASPAASRSSSRTRS